MKVTKKKTKINWWEVIELSPEEFLEKDNIYIDAANNWVTCACGNLCDVIPRLDDGEPIDDELSDLGVTFANLISDVAGIANSIDIIEEDYLEDRDAIYLKELKKEYKETMKKVAKTLNKIEKRAARIIVQEERKAIKVLEKLGWSINNNGASR